MRRILRLAIPTLVAALLVGCNRGGTAAPAVIPTAAPSGSASPSASPAAKTTASPTASATPSRLPSPFPTAPAGPTPPAGYATSCASGAPWGVQVKKLFVCIDEPKAGASVAQGGTLVVRGYAGGSFENNVVVEVRLVDAAGRLAADTIAFTPLTYVATDMGMPGFWQAIFTLPAGGQPSKARVIAHFESPRDGARVAEASVDIVIR